MLKDNKFKEKNFEPKDLRIIASKSYSTLREISSVGNKACRKTKNQLDVSSFGRLFGLDIEGQTHIYVPNNLSFIRDESEKPSIPVLYIGFDKANSQDVDMLMKGLEDALYVSTYTEEEFANVDMCIFRESERNVPRPVVNYEGHLLRTDELQFEKKFADIKDSLPADVVAFVEEKIEENGPTMFEDEVINNFAHIMSLHQSKAADYNYAVMDAMEMHMQKGEQYGNVPKGIYECDMVYTDAIMNLYERNLHEQELELELEM